MQKNDYELDKNQFQKMFITQVRDTFSWGADGQRGGKTGIAIDCVNVSHKYDPLSVRLEGMAEPSFPVPQEGFFKEGTEIKFTDLRVTQYPKRNGGGMALSATASDARLVSNTPAPAKA